MRKSLIALAGALALNSSTVESVHFEAPPIPRTLSDSIEREYEIRGSSDPL